MIKQEKITWKIVTTALIVAAITFIATWFLRPQPKTDLKLVTIFTHPLLQTNDINLVISPDGTKFVYSGTGFPNKLYLRRIDELIATQIDNTEGAYRPFFSPDSRELCFYSRYLVNERMLKKVLIDSGANQTLCDLPNGYEGGTWGDDGAIIFSSEGFLFRIPASGGTPDLILAPDSGKTDCYCDPEILPGSKAVLYTVIDGNYTDYDKANIAVYSLKSGESKVLITGGTDPRYIPTGHILFGRSGSCWAVPFDLKKLTITGPEVLVQEGIHIGSTGVARFDVSINGTLVYIPDVKRTLILVDRHGFELLFTDARLAYYSPRFAPDGKQVATEIDRSGNYHIFILNALYKGSQSALTMGYYNNRFPEWTPDGQKVTFQSEKSGIPNIYWKEWDADEEMEPLIVSENPLYGGTWSDDGTLFAFHELKRSFMTNTNIWVYRTRDRTAAVFLKSQYNEEAPAISLDGKWIAYTSDRTDQNEVYMTHYPDADPVAQVSTEGGVQPVWSPDGRELFYREGDKMMAVSVETQPSLKLGGPERLFEKKYFGDNYVIPQYDIHPDGDHFLMIKGEESVTNQVNIVLNWFEVLKEKMAGVGE